MAPGLLGHHQHRRRRSRWPPVRCSSRPRRGTRSWSRWRCSASSSRGCCSASRPAPSPTASIDVGSSPASNLARGAVLSVLAGTIVDRAPWTSRWSCSRCSSWALRRRSPTSASSSLLPGLVAREDLGHRQRAHAGRVPAHEPASGAADRGVPVRARHGAAVRGQRRLLRARRRARHARRRERRRHRDRASGDWRSLRADMAEGIRWLVGHPPMRTLALTIFAFNVTFGAAWAVLVLYASERLGMDAGRLRAARRPPSRSAGSSGPSATAGSSDGSRWPTSCGSAC